MSRRLVLLLALAACHSSLDAPPDIPPDASTQPRTVDGTFRVTSSFDLAQAPPQAAAILDLLADATDEPDDPGRFLVERMIDALPDGATKTIAVDLEPVLAACVQSELADIAPRLAPGFVAMARGLERYARHFATNELWQIEPSGQATRIVTGFTFDSADAALETAALGDRFATMQVSLSGGELVVAEHSLQLPYGALLRLALDQAVVPTVDAGATDLARALSDLVDCERLGAAFAQTIGFGPQSLYSAACGVALTDAADAFYARLAAIDDLPLSLAGEAQALDRDGDGTMDVIASGAWTGSLDLAGNATPMGAASFSGAR